MYGICRSLYRRRPVNLNNFNIFHTAQKDRRLQLWKQLEILNIIVEINNDQKLLYVPSSHRLNAVIESTGVIITIKLFLILFASDGYVFSLVFSSLLKIGERSKYIYR